jgi:hypothetical protein
MEDTETILFDDCEGCARHATNLGLTLDEGWWQNMWGRMLSVEIHFGGIDHYRSNNEAKLGNQMYQMYVALERYTQIDPKNVFGPWRL